MRFENPPHIAATASVVGKKEGEGPLRTFFDVIDETDLFGGENWEDAESGMLKQAAELAVKKAGYEKSEIEYILAGDLLGQLIASAFGIAKLDIPFLGIYGACSTMGEGLLVGAMLVDGGFADRVVNVTSSHFASAEKEFRFPLGYGNQRPLAATWTVTGSGAAVLVSEAEAKKRGRSLTDAAGSRAALIVPEATVGRIVDYGVKDKSNMGACMAPAACQTVAAHLKDFNRKPEDYDKIITGDLGTVGSEIFLDLLSEKGYDAKAVHADCGLMIYDNEAQDTHSGGSGCGCSAATFAGYLTNELREGKLKRILFVPTGALLSPVSANEGNSIPGIAHAVVIERKI